MKVLDLGKRKKKRKVILVNLGCYRTPNPQTIMAVQRILCDETLAVMGYEPVLRMEAQSDLYSMRNHTVRHAYELAETENLEGILWVDDDMLFPVGQVKQQDGELVNFNPLVRLLGRQKDIIGGLYTSRKFPIVALAGRMDESGTMRPIDDPRLMDLNASDPFEVDYLGFGLIYTSFRSILTIQDRLGVPRDKFFESELNWQSVDGVEERLLASLKLAAGGATTERALSRLKKDIDSLIRSSERFGDDVSFCVRAKKAGLKVWADPSFDLLHVGDYPYGRIDWLAAHKFQMEKVAAEGR